MDKRLIDAEDLNGLLLIRDTLQLSASFLVPHLLQLALSVDLQASSRVRMLMSSVQSSESCSECNVVGLAGVVAVGAGHFAALPASS